MANETKFTAFSFNAATVPPAAPIEAIPADYYNVAITDAEVKPNSSGTGTMIAFTLTVLDGPFKGRKIFDQLNVSNPSAQAQEIAQQQLSAICHATGLIEFTDVQQLYNRPFSAKISVDPKRAVLNGQTVPLDTPGAEIYEARNKFKGAKAIGAGATAAPVAGTGVPSGAIPAWAAKPGAATPPPAAAATPPAAAPATSPAAAPTASVGAPQAPKGPKGPKKPAAPAAPAAPARKFFVFISETEMPLKTEAEVAAMLAAGMPPDTMISLADKDDGFIDDSWKPAGSFNIGTAAPAAATPAGAPVAPPWTVKK